MLTAAGHRVRLRLHALKHIWVIQGLLQASSCSCQQQVLLLLLVPLLLLLPLLLLSTCKWITQQILLMGSQQQLHLRTQILRLLGQALGMVLGRQSCLLPSRSNLLLLLLLFLQGHCVLPFLQLSLKGSVKLPWDPTIGAHKGS